jgi:hypothetical protein
MVTCSMHGGKHASYYISEYKRITCITNQMYLIAKTTCKQNGKLISESLHVDKIYKTVVVLETSKFVIIFRQMHHAQTPICLLDFLTD